MKNKTVLKEACVLLVATILVLTAIAIVPTAGAQSTVVWSEDWSGASPPALPTGWSTTHPLNWETSNTNYADGTSPEVKFKWWPASDSIFQLYTTDLIDIAGYTNCYLDFNHRVNHYSGDYTLKVETKTVGGSWSPIWTQPSGSYGPGPGGPISLASVTSPFYLSFTFEGYSWNINYWFIDDIEIVSYCYIEIDSIHAGSDGKDVYVDVSNNGGVDLTDVPWTMTFTVTGGPGGSPGILGRPLGGVASGTIDIPTSGATIYFDDVSGNAEFDLTVIVGCAEETISGEINGKKITFY